ncbi:putative Zn-dependent protease [Sulfurisoma sediminicola]|uniref:Putative Zn-dependent protease n=2 Tax=Sulfurisoma sediminicola TaxID=1381557 RepID=A0A497XCC8_9PROT|nr:putative Zn-dependent protease [Sulfurisoma sediminicola]
MLALAPAAVAEGLPDLGDVAQVDLSPQAEKQIGASIFRDIRLREASYLDDPEITGYLNRLGMRLVAHSGEARQDFQFFVLRDSTLNAFAMPGGYIGVHTGLIAAAQSESELASVIAHEISHVTQHHLARMVGKQSQAQLVSMLALAVAVLAARSNSELATGAMMAGQAAGLQSQLNYSRDFEREADRLGINLLENSGYDIRGMGSFFERLQNFGRLYENNAPVYLRTHPLTTERIADMGNRISQRPYRQVPDSLDFLLVRAKLKAQEDDAREAVTHFASLVKERKFSSEPAAYYGYAVALTRLKDWAGAERELGQARRFKAASPMVETLAAELRRQQGDADGAFRLLRAAAQRYPQERAVSYALMETLLGAGRLDEAQQLGVADVQLYPSDTRMLGLLAKTYALLGKVARQHRTQAEVYVANGQLLAAIEQLQFAQQARDGDFYDQAQIDARLRELKRQQAEEMRRR